uniref:Putative odorant-binding protein n=1 Tax=Triatoma brasiliensis TaxID=65344 RepID=A0A163E263_TRIBS|nr:putative odorant-binding protein [Triatoma brasiliensis]
MPKFYTSLLAFFIFSFFSMIIGNEEECMRQHNISRSFLDDEKREDKCFLACFMKEQKIMNEEGHMVKEKMLEYFDQVEGDHPHAECREAVLHCVDMVEKEGDDCETAYKFDLCVNEKETVCALDEN